MAQPKPVLKIFSLSQPLMHTEWKSILGDKYCHGLPFDYALTENAQEASVIAWDGVISPKQNRYEKDFKDLFTANKVLLRMGESQTLFQDHPYVKNFDTSHIPTVELTGWSVLPEDLLEALQTCFQKISHV